MRRFTHKEEEVMTILWRLERAFVNDILNEMEEKPPYNTVSSIVRKLVAEGFVGYEAFGKTHRYFPILKKEDYRANAFRSFMDNYFGGSPSALLSYFVKEENVAPDDLSRLLEEIKKSDSGQ
ncbi:MAG: BlaI/MecI/CopY family transcriptional regulator [Haliscomenobacteraceae bacterium CHB4]|nr:Methicillin resistance regulatory protein MecI [Saprospiraceae bacterium]MCE7922355.1 BlaI/MecI/CopY family transcriptional regulator [Haliscomenobacteraceae bacterium CHB4]